jgi:glyoxylase-like metal-dependent hydrolase (beta-lactamase superfamily II)
MTAELKELGQFSPDKTSPLTVPKPWGFRAVVNEDNLTYLIWNEESGEGIVVDPGREDLELLKKTMLGIKTRWLMVIDTHTHADHISCGEELSKAFGIPWVMSSLSETVRPELRIHRDLKLPLKAGALEFLTTPGHTPDGLTLLWGPFVFTGDTILYGDTGRDDLPGGDPKAHYESLVKISKAVKPGMILLPGHDGRGGRASTWEDQLKVNASLTQERESFISEAGAFTCPAPRLFKESLFENLK